jgi:signal transduction histidine kinase
MRRLRITGTAAFRLALAYAALFAVSAAVLVAIFDVTISQYARRTLRAGVANEVQLLQRTAPGGQDSGVAQLVRERQRALGSQEFRYLVFSRNGGVLAGDLPVAAAHSGWGEIAVPAPAESREFEGETDEVRTLGAILPGGGLLVVGRSTYAFHELRETMLNTTIAAGILVGLLSLGAALLIGSRFLARIDRVNAAAVRIMEGRLDERLPTIGMGDEFDRLAASLNAMLDRMQGLMEGLRQVSSDIAHDLRTPLTRLRRRLEEALVDEGANPDRDALVHEALGQIEEILATFSALLRIAQVEGGSGSQAFGPVNLSELMDRVRQIYEPVAEDEGKQLSAEVAPGLAVNGDEGLLAQLISNLVENAFVHAPSPGKVTLAATADGPRAVISVADDGPGVPAEEREKVVRRFYRLDRSRTTPGAGLGLSMVQAIAQLHHAELELADNGPGLIARVTFPRLTEAKLENP